jgi:hypothetical protein
MTIQNQSGSDAAATANAKDKPEFIKRGSIIGLVNYKFDIQCFKNPY